MTVYILGAGPAGLAVAHGLVEGGFSGDFVLIERGATLGGLAQTVCWEGVGNHDLGPHKIFTTDGSLMQRVEKLLSPQQWLTRDKISSIYMNGHYLPYPPSPFSLAKVFGMAAFISMVWGYGWAKIHSLLSSSEPRTFEDDLRGRLGGGLYSVLFEPIARKLWGDPRKLDVKLSRGRVQTPSLWEVLARMLKLRNKSEFEALDFRYPVGGLGKLWESIHAKTLHKGRFLTDHTVTGLTFSGDRVSGIRCRAGRTGEQVDLVVKPEDFVVSTMPLAPTVRLMSGRVSAAAVERVDDVVVLNDLLLVFLHLEQTSLLPESWVFVPDPSIAFHRLSEQESFDPSMSPKGTIVCCEIMSNELRNMSAQSDAELIDACKQGLSRMGYTGWKVLNERVIRLPKSYPVFRPGFEAGLAQILGELDRLENFRSIGRQGAFNYIGTLDAMDIGYGCARWLQADRKVPWQAERERTNHYPVLD